MSKYTFDDLWAELGEWGVWVQSMPKWWQFRKRRAWLKAEPKWRGADHE